MNRLSHSVDKLINDIKTWKLEYEEVFAQRVVMYLWCACVGEARHACVQPARHFFIRETQGLHRQSLFILAKEFPMTESNIKTLKSVFTQEWTSSFGGKKWGQIVDAIGMYGKVTNGAFLDHVVDLEHNNGTVFSKDDGLFTIDFDIRYTGDMKEFLDFKFRADLWKQTPPFDIYITKKTSALIDRYCTIFGKKRPARLNGELRKPEPLFIEWGNREFTVEQKWNDWADCHIDNRPHVEDFISHSSISKNLPEWSFSSWVGHSS